MTSTTPIKLQSYEKDQTKIIYSINRLWDRTYIGTAPNGYISVDNTQQIAGLGGITVYERNRWQTNTAASGGRNTVAFLANPFFGDCSVSYNYLNGFACNPDPVPAGTAAPISGFEFTVTTAQTVADTGSEDVHAFGCSIEGTGTADICGADLSITATGASNLAGGSRIGLFVNNASANNTFGYQAGSYGSTNGQIAFWTVGTWQSGYVVTGTVTGNAFQSSNFAVTGVGQVVAGRVSPPGDVFGNTPQITASKAAASTIMVEQWTADANGPYITLKKSRGASIGTATTVQNNDSLGFLDATGYDATGGTPVLQSAAAVLFAVDGAPGAGSVPGRILFDTMTTGGVLTEALRINSSQQPNFWHGSAVPAGGNSNLGLTFFSSTNLGIYFGSGAPSLSAAQGSIYINTTGAAGARLYYNTTGSTTWVAATTP